MCEQVGSEGGGGRRRRQAGVHNQKQEPHTKMWGKHKISKTRLSVRGGNQNCFNIGRATCQGNAATSF